MRCLAEAATSLSSAANWIGLSWSGCICAQYTGTRTVSTPLDRMTPVSCA